MEVGHLWCVLEEYILLLGTFLSLLPSCPEVSLFAQSCALPHDIQPVLGLKQWGQVTMN
jgi:hypothetical protein